MIREWGATDCVVVGTIHWQLVFTEAVEVKVGLGVVRETEICLLVESLCVCMCASCMYKIIILRNTYMQLSMCAMYYVYPCEHGVCA